MPEFKCEVKELVAATIEITVRARSKKAAAKKAYDQWVIHGQGSLHEDVRERWVEVGGDQVEVEEDD